MKIITEFFPIRELKGPAKGHEKGDVPGKTISLHDRITLSKTPQVIEENRAASCTEPLDMRMAEAAIADLREQIAAQEQVVADVHDMNPKKVLLLSSHE